MLLLKGWSLSTPMLPFLDPPQLYADREKINIILRNLIGNAFKFCLPNTTNHINVRLSYFNKRLEISVTDTGIGIRPENVHKIFEEFTQLHGDSRRAFEGTGLGLSMVKAIVELMTGTIQVRSTLGEGSTFTIVLPDQEDINQRKAVADNGKRTFEVSIVGESQVSELPPESEEDRVEKVEPLTVVSKNYKVLVVDDNEVNREIIHEILKSSGFITELAAGGQEALEMIEKNPPDLVLLDLMMPEVSEDVLKYLKGKPKFADPTRYHLNGKGLRRR